MKKKLLECPSPPGKLSGINLKLHLDSPPDMIPLSLYEDKENDSINLSAENQGWFVLNTQCIHNFLVTPLRYSVNYIQYAPMKTTQVV